MSGDLFLMGITGEEIWDQERAMVGLRLGIFFGLAKGGLGAILKPDMKGYVFFKIGSYMVKSAAGSITKQAINYERIDWDKVLFTAIIGGFGGWMATGDVGKVHKVTNELILELIKIWGVK